MCWNNTKIREDRMSGKKGTYKSIQEVAKNGEWENSNETRDSKKTLRGIGHDDGQTRWGEELLVEIINVRSCLHSFITSWNARNRNELKKLMRWNVKHNGERMTATTMKTRTRTLMKSTTMTTTQRWENAMNKQQQRNWVKILNHFCLLVRRFVSF